MLNSLIHFVQLAQANFWLSVGYYVIFVFGTMFLPITPFPIAGGVLFPFWIALPLNILAATAGAWLSFMVTRTFGHKAVHQFLVRRFPSFDKVADMEGFRTVLILRLVGIPPFIVSNYALGFSEVRHRDFLFGTMVGLLPWMTIVSFLSHSLWDAILVGGEKGLTKALAHALGPLTIVSVLVAAIFLVKFLIKKRKSAI